ncbi:hypothetical protein ABW19_dt0202549 [Dactylella cylindrospora]|nr:hypothetical protein ABW19_dt0202549 [Dactylella cylindrospora]
MIELPSGGVPITAKELSSAAVPPIAIPTDDPPKRTSRKPATEPTKPKQPPRQLEEDSPAPRPRRTAKTKPKPKSKPSIFDKLADLNQKNRQNMGKPGELTPKYVVNPFTCLQRPAEICNHDAFWNELRVPLELCAKCKVEAGEYMCPNCGTMCCLLCREEAKGRKSRRYRMAG